MNIIDNISSKKELMSIRSHFEKVFSENLSLNFKSRKLDEITALLIGVVDFNTALGIVDDREDEKDSFALSNLQEKIGKYGVLADLENIEAMAGELIEQYLLMHKGQGFIDEFICEMDELVFDYIGRSQSISDDINNGGLSTQITAVANAVGLSVIWDLIAEMCGSKEFVCDKAFIKWAKSYLSKPTCKKCGADINLEGYCLDETCSYQDWPQQCYVIDLGSLSDEDIEASYGIKKRTRVVATVGSDDQVTEVEFNATAYFSDAIFSRT